MNWRPCTFSPALVDGVWHLPPPAGAPWLEGSLAALPTLAPVIALFPIAEPHRGGRRRSGRQKT
jgi:hypothetical protein